MNAKVHYTYLPTRQYPDRRRDAELTSQEAAAQLGDRVMGGWTAVQRYVVAEDGSTCSVTCLLSVMETVWAIYVSESWK